MAVLKFEKDLLKKKHMVVLFETPDENFEELFYSYLFFKELKCYEIFDLDSGKIQMLSMSY